MNPLSDLAVILLAEPSLWAREGLRTTIKPDGSPVTSADLRIDCLLREYLSERFPGIWIVSEEDSSTFDVPDVELVAQIDPLDGTENFLSGLPIWGVSVSVSRSGAHQCSLLAFPEMGLSLSTGQSFHSFSSRIEGHASSTPLAQVTSASRSSENRILGSATYNLYCVATGRFSRFVNPSGAHSWDILAGLNLAAEQGCEVLVDGADYQGEFLDPRRKYRVEVRRQANRHTR